MSWKSIRHTPSRVQINMDDFIAHIMKYVGTDGTHTIVDAGSLDGNDAELLWKAFPHSKSYAIEGLPDNFNTFIKNRSNITGIHAVIASHDGECTYYQKDINGIHGIYDRGASYGTQTLTLPCYTMDTIMKKNDIKSIDVIKIDVEGATLDLLQSFSDNQLHAIKIMHIETETYPFFKGQKLHEEVCAFLENNDFKCVDMTYAEITPGCYQSDSVWVNKKFI